jgi:hypothetical protein
MAEEGENSFWVVLDTPATSARSLPPHEGDSFEAQAGRLRALFQREPKELDFNQVKKEWNQRLKQVDALVEVADAEASTRGIHLTEIELGLTLTAEGHLAFIASASASASLKVKFTR